MSTYNPVDNKLLFRIDFRPTLKYYDEMYKIASSLENEYEHWKAARNPTVGVLFDPVAKKQLNIGGQSISLTTKNDALISDPFEEISKLLLLFLSASEVNTIVRIGIRRRGIYNVNRTYDEFTDAFFETFYNSREELKEIAADKIDDVVVILQGIKDGFQNRGQFGPLKEEQIELLYGVEEFESLEDINLNKKTAVLVDTDIFSLTESDLDEAMSTIKDLLTVADKMYEDTWKLIKSKI